MRNKLPVRCVVEANTECLANISGEGKEKGRLPLAELLL